MRCPKNICKTGEIKRRLYKKIYVLRFTLFIFFLTLFACTPIPETATPLIPTATLPATSTRIPTPTLAPTYTPPLPATAISTPISELTTSEATIVPSPSPTSARDPYAGLRIAELIDRTYGGGQLEIVETLERNAKFNRYLIRYPSDNLMIYGFMNVPQAGDVFPVALVLHGFINPEKYETLDYSTAYADTLAEAGYLVIHPNYRNHAPSDAGENVFRIGYALDVLNLMGIVREQSLDKEGVLRRADGEDMHILGHSMGGGIALRVMAVRPQWVRAVVLYSSMSGDEAKNYAKISEWTEGRSGIFERRTSEVELQNISPLYHLERSWNVPVSVHHGDDDGIVPLAWAEETCGALEQLGYIVTCYTYAGQPHNFYGGGDNRFVERMLAFFELH